MIPRLVIGTKNPHKLDEIRDVLEGSGLADEIVTDLDWEDVDETGETIADNALLKARSVVAVTGLPALADDTGLEVDALDGAPGVRSSRFAGVAASYEQNRRKLLHELEGVEARSARFRSVIALVFPDGAEVLADGVLEGSITNGPRGSGGFGYDPLFEVDGCTLAEMSGEEKNRLSHRALALRALCRELGL